MAVKPAYTSNEIAPLLGITRQGVEHRAHAEGWKFQQRKGRGGGREWLLDGMPEQTRLTIAAALVRGMVGEPLEARALVDVGQMPERAGAKDRAEARALVSRMAQEFHRGSGKARTIAYTIFASRYNDGEISVVWWVRAALPRLCASSLVNWERTLKASGVAALGGAYGAHRKGKGIFDANEEVQTFSLGHIFDFPHASARQLQKGLKARFRNAPDVRLPRCAAYKCG